MIETVIFDGIAKVGVPAFTVFLMYKIILFLLQSMKEKDKTIDNNTEALKELSVAVATCPIKK